MRTDGLNDIVMTTSDDGMRRSTPAPVAPSSNEGSKDTFDPTLAVDGSGAVSIAYLQPEESTGRIDTTLQLSTDRGAAFRRLLRVKPIDGNTDFAGISAETGADRNKALPFFGGYIGLAVQADAAYVARPGAINATNAPPCLTPITNTTAACESPTPLWHHQRRYLATIRSG